MADIKGTPGGLKHKRDQMYRDEGDGTFTEDRSALMRAWNAVTLAYQRLTVSNSSGGLGVHILGSDVSSSGGTSSADGATYTAGTTAGTPLMGARDDAATATLAEDKVGIARLTALRAVHVNLRDAAGAELAVGGGTQYTEDAAAAADPVGTALNLVRADSPAAVTNTDGDNVAARGTNKGELYVKHIDAVPVTDNAGSLTVDGSVSLAAAIPAGTNAIGKLAANSGVDIGDVDVTSLPALPAGTNLIGGVNVKPATSGGLSVFHLVAAASTNATNVKASAGQLFGWYIYNSNAAARKVAFHNTAGTPTAGASIFFTATIPPGSAANVEFTNGIAFGTGIAITTVTGLADNDAVAVAANDLIINLFFA